jgi:hypothetical protein
MRRGWKETLVAGAAAVGTTLVFAAPALATVPANTVAPTVSGSPAPAQTLTANKGTWTGSPTPTYAYQWLLCTSTTVSSCASISGATGATYTTPSNYNNAQKRYAVKVTATNSSGSASATSATTAAVPEPPAPVLSLSGRMVTWPAIPYVSQYVVAVVRHPTTTRETTYSVINTNHYTPTQDFPGEHVNYGVRAYTTAADPYPPWAASEMTLNWPIIGLGAATGWGSTAAATVHAGHVDWDRIDMGTATTADSHVTGAIGAGFDVLGVVGNVADGTPLSSVTTSTWASNVVTQMQSNPGLAMAEAGNEMYFKGGVANPVKYGQMYLAAVNALSTAGIHTKLLFNMWGDYFCGTTGVISCPSNGWSQDSQGRGWLADAVNGVPGLAAAIAANGVSTHPYGAIGQNNADESGTAAVAAQESAAQAALGTIPPFYVTEMGFDLDLCGNDSGACSQADQATKLGQAMAVFLGDDHVEGVWWFQAWDYGSGNAWGILDTPVQAGNGAGAARPAFTTLSNLAVQYGQ